MARRLRPRTCRWDCRRPCPDLTRCLLNQSCPSAGGVSPVNEFVVSSGERENHAVCCVLCLLCWIKCLSLLAIWLPGRTLPPPHRFPNVGFFFFILFFASRDGVALAGTGQRRAGRVCLRVLMWLAASILLLLFSKPDILSLTSSHPFPNIFYYCFGSNFPLPHVCWVLSIFFSGLVKAPSHNRLRFGSVECAD